VSEDDLRSNRLEALLAEYGCLREESLRGIDNRITIMNFTFGALSIVLASLLANRVPRSLAGIVGLLFVPQVAKAALLIWLGEYNRSQRAGRQIVAIESRVNELLGATLISWETALAKRASGHMKYPYWATVALVIGAGYGGIGIGAFLLLHGHRGVGLAVGIALIVVYALVVEGLFLAFFVRKWHEATSSTDAAAGATSSPPHL